MASNDTPAPALGALREELGIRVRRVWQEWAYEQPNPKASWLLDWEDLSEADREVDRRIGEALYRVGYDAQAARLAMMTQALEYISHSACYDPGEGGCIGQSKCPRCTAKEVLHARA